MKKLLLLITILFLCSCSTKLIPTEDGLILEEDLDNIPSFNLEAQEHLDKYLELEDSLSSVSFYLKTTYQSKTSLDDIYDSVLEGDSYYIKDKEFYSSGKNTITAISTDDRKVETIDVINYSFISDNMVKSYSLDEKFGTLQGERVWSYSEKEYTEDSDLYNSFYLFPLFLPDYNLEEEGNIYVYSGKAYILKDVPETFYCKLKLDKTTNLPISIYYDVSTLENSLLDSNSILKLEYSNIEFNITKDISLPEDLAKAKNNQDHFITLEKPKVDPYPDLSPEPEAPTWNSLEQTKLYEDEIISINLDNTEWYSSTENGSTVFTRYFKSNDKLCVSTIVISPLTKEDIGNLSPMDYLNSIRGGLTFTSEESSTYTVISDSSKLSTIEVHSDVFDNFSRITSIITSGDEYLLVDMSTMTEDSLKSVYIDLKIATEYIYNKMAIK